MPTIQTAQSNSIFYQDYGKGQPIILIHGWPLSHKAWEHQIDALVSGGFRCLAIDRRGFGQSSAPWESYDYSTLASDIHTLITQLDLNNVVMIGFSMGGGEVVRYFTDYGSEYIDKAVLISSIIPLVQKKGDNPEGIPTEILNDTISILKNNRINFLKEFHENFYNFDILGGKRVTQAQLDNDFIIASQASARGTIECAKSWAFTDFRNELKNIDRPTLIIHGDADRAVPIKTAGDQAAKGITDNEYHILKDGPHGVLVTHKDEINSLLLQFLDK